MRITVNGTSKEVHSRILSDILSECGFHHSHVATALNEEFVHRHLRETTVVQPGDRLEVVAPNAGG